MHRDRDLYAVLWTLDGEAHCALYEDVLHAVRDADRVGGRVELRVVHATPVARDERFERA